MPRYDTVLFDLDGTLLNTLQDLTNATNAALRKNGYSERTIDEVRGFVGNGVALLARRSLPESLHDNDDIAMRVFEDLKAYYAEHNSDCTAPYDGIIEMLEALRTKGIKLAVVSNKNDPNVQALCARYFGGMIDGCMGEREGLRRKPACDMPHKMLEELGSIAEHSLYVGDSGVDIETARNAGMDCAVVSWGFWDRERLIAAGAERLFGSAEELKGFILG